jgi:aryl-alcohol dehydrogenase-like predicted oxidoreductase
MKYRRLGRSGLQVSEISLGSWTTYGGSVDEGEAIRLIHRAFELGINLFDTADVYIRGAAEEVLGKAVQSLPREQIVVATKVMGRVWDGPLGAGLSRKHVFDAMDRSLKRLRLDYVDLYQLHAPDKNTPLEETLRALEDLVRSGRARYVGFSNFDHHPPLDRQALAIQKAHGWDRFVSSQPRYNLLDRAVERGGHMALCRAHGVGLIVYSPLAQGVLTNKYAAGARPEGSRAAGAFAHFMTSEKALTDENLAAAQRFATWVEGKGVGTPTQVALAWVLRRPEVSSAIIGATRADQLEENAKAVEIQLSDAEWREAEKAIAGAPAPEGTGASRRRGAKRTSGGRAGGTARGRPRGR